MTNSAAPAAPDASIAAEQAEIVSPPIALVVNGEARHVPSGSSLGDLLRMHALDPRMVVVEHNRSILRDRASFDALALADGDAIEIVHFVGGG
jgi:thiamine biosynthesis protein ThiS